MFSGILLLILEVTAFAQENILLKEDFKNNKNKWHVQNDSDFIVYIKHGVLHLEKLYKNFDRRGCLWYYKNVPGFNTLNNFHIIIYAKYIVGGDGFDLFDIIWGDKGVLIQNRYNANIYQMNFLISRGEVRLNHFNMRWDYPPNLNIKSLLSKEFDAHQINKYEVIQKDGFIYFLINDIELLKQSRKPIAGNNIGFQQCLKSTWEIDKIEIRQKDVIKLTNSDTLKLITDTTIADKFKLPVNR